MKNSNVDWIGEIPSHWQLVSTKRVLRGIKRIVGSEVDDYERLALTMNGVIRRKKDDNEGLQPEKFDNYQILKTNELVFKLIDLQNEKTSRVGLSPYTGIVSPAYIVLTNEQTDNRYYYYWFFDMYNRLIFNQMSDDGVRANLNVNDLVCIPIPRISEKEQKAIADFLDVKCAEIDEMISLQEKIIEELMTYKHAVIRESITKGLNSKHILKDTHIDSIGRIPSHWELKKIKFFSTVVRGGSPRPAGDTRYYEGSVPFMKVADITRNDEIFVDTTEYTIKEEGRKFTRTIEAGTLLLTNSGATLGIPKITAIQTTINDGIAAFLDVSNRIDLLFFYYYLKSQTKMFLELAALGIGQPNLNTEIIGNTPMPIPPIEEQKTIVDFLNIRCSEIDSLISLKQSKIESLKEYKKSIIYEYVTGKKEVEA